ncbi:MAG: efflux RND transporter permease subunit [Acidithiobacillus sp.]|nr:efflux RND transporter permease subunit [Acidithiobacillus sp.]
MNEALQIPGLSNIWTQPLKGWVDMLTTGLQTPLGIKVGGTDLATLYSLGQEIQTVLRKVPGTQSAYAARITGGRYIVVRTDRAKAAIAQAAHLPGAYTLSWVDQYQVMEQAAKRLELDIPAVILLIALLLYFSFKNWVEVAIILLILPLSLVGGCWLGYKLSVAVGFIALAGVAAEFGVVMLFYLDQALIRHQARGALQDWHDLQVAVIEGTMLRLRPLAMTFTLVVGGLLPIMFSHGADADVMKRIAAPMVGGMFSAALLALLVIPAPPTPCGKNGDWAYGEDSIDKEKLMASELKRNDLLAMAHEDDFSRDGLGCQG